MPSCWARARSGGRIGHQAAADACRLLRRNAILVTPHRQIVPDNLPSNIRWYDYLPFSRIMPHVAAVIHHGGIGTLAQTLATGIPQLVLGIGFDRPDNGTRIKQLKVGDYLPPPHWQPDRIAEALSQLLHSNDVSLRCREFARQIRLQDAASFACNIIESSIPSSCEPRISQQAGILPVSSALSETPRQRANGSDLPPLTQSLSPERRAL